MTEVNPEGSGRMSQSSTRDHFRTRSLQRDLASFHI